MEVKSLIEKQRMFFNTNATKKIDFRVNQLKKLRSVIQQNEKLLYDAIYADFRKSEFDTYTSELALLYQEINDAIKNVKKWSKTKKAGTNLVNFPAKSYIIPEPFGVSLVIGAWNYPYQLSLVPAVSALAAGNTVLLKPSELPLNTSKAMAKIINENFNAELFHVIEGGVAETTVLLDQKFDKIFFTGSVPVGKIVYQAAAKHLTPVTLELGGKSPAFITEDCNMDVSVQRLIWAKFLNAGQTCIAPDYVLVQKSVEQKFIEKSIEEIRKSRFSFENDNYVQIINEKNFDRLVKLLDKAKIVFGGKHDRVQRFIEPTIMSHVSMGDLVMEDEIFGPILPVLTYDKLEEAISLVKSMPKPLSCYVFTNDNEQRRKVLSEISFGGGAVNDAIMHISNGNLPFGGVGDSGIGNYHKKAGFQAFSHYKSILDKPYWLELSLKYFPHTASKFKWIKFLMK